MGDPHELPLPHHQQRPLSSQPRRQPRGNSAMSRRSGDSASSSHPRSANYLSVTQMNKRSNSGRSSSESFGKLGSPSQEDIVSSDMFLRSEPYTDNDNESECSIPLTDIGDVDALSDAFTSSSMIRANQKAPSIKPRKTAWGQFTEHIRGINCDAMHFQMKPTSNKGSDTFREVLTDFQPELPTRPKSRTKPGSALGSSRKFVSSSNGFRKGEYNVKNNSINTKLVDLERENMSSRKDSADQISVTITTSSPVTPGSLGKGQVNAQTRNTNRTWRKVKDADDKYLHKVSEEKTSWDLSKTVVQLTDQEKARQTLYDRYLRNPTPWYEGLVLYNKYKHLLDADNKKRRPMSSPHLIRRTKMASWKAAKRPVSVISQQTV